MNLQEEESGLSQDEQRNQNVEDLDIVFTSKNLDMSYNDMKEFQLFNIIRVVKQANFSGNPFKSLQFLHCFPKLRVLHVDEVEIADCVLEQLFPLKNLQILTLRSDHLTSLTSLPPFVHLRLIDVSQNFLITLSDVTRAKYPNLRDLVFANNPTLKDQTDLVFKRGFLCDNLLLPVENGKTTLESETLSYNKFKITCNLTDRNRQKLVDIKLFMQINSCLLRLVTSASCTLEQLTSHPILTQQLLNSSNSYIYELTSPQFKPIEAQIAKCIKKSCSSFFLVLGVGAEAAVFRLTNEGEVVCGRDTMQKSIQSSPCSVDGNYKQSSDTNLQFSNCFNFRQQNQNSAGLDRNCRNSSSKINLNDSAKLQSKNIVQRSTLIRQDLLMQIQSGRNGASYNSPQLSERLQELLFLSESQFQKAQKETQPTFSDTFNDCQQANKDPLFSQIKQLRCPQTTCHSNQGAQQIEEADTTFKEFEQQNAFISSPEQQLTVGKASLVPGLAQGDQNCYISKQDYNEIIRDVIAQLAFHGLVLPIKEAFQLLLHSIQQFNLSGQMFQFKGSKIFVNIPVIVNRIKIELCIYLKHIGQVRKNVPITLTDSCMDRYFVFSDNLSNSIKFLEVPVFKQTVFYRGEIVLGAQKLDVVLFDKDGNEAAAPTSQFRFFRNNYLIQSTYSCSLDLSALPDKTGTYYAQIEYYDYCQSRICKYETQEVLVSINSAQQLSYQQLEAIRKQPISEGPILISSYLPNVVPNFQQNTAQKDNIFQNVGYKF